MFKQFIGHANDAQIYLISSLAIFLIFFIVVSVMLFRMHKQYADYMGDIPLQDADNKQLTGTES